MHNLLIWLNGDQKIRINIQEKINPLHVNIFTRGHFSKEHC